jgi:type IV pilus assembly protein PilF
VRAFVLVALALLSSACISPKRASRAQARVDLGVAYFREGNTEGAVATLDEATRLDPRNWRAWNSLAVAYVAKGRNELAERTFERALRLAPDEAEVLLAYGAYRVRTGDAEGGVDAFGKALADLDYRNPAVVHSNLSYALLLVGRPSDAVSHAREAVRRAPALCEARYNLGLALEMKGDPLGALDAYDAQARECPDESLGARLRAGCIQYGAGLVDEGRAVLDAVVAAAPSTDFASTARACMQGQPAPRVGPSPSGGQ